MKTLNDEYQMFLELVRAYLKGYKLDKIEVTSLHHAAESFIEKLPHYAAEIKKYKLYLKRDYVSSYKKKHLKKVRDLYTSYELSQQG